MNIYFIKMLRHLLMSQVYVEEFAKYHVHYNKPQGT